MKGGIHMNTNTITRRKDNLYRTIIYVQFCTIVCLIGVVGLQQSAANGIMNNLVSSANYAIEQVENFFRHMGVESSLSVATSANTAMHSKTSMAEQPLLTSLFGDLQENDMTLSNSINSNVLDLVAMSTYDESIEFEKNIKIGSLFEGDSIHPVLAVNNYYGIEFGDTVGYISSDFVTMDFTTGIGAISNTSVADVFSTEVNLNVFNGGTDVNQVITNAYTFDESFLRSIIEIEAPALLGIEGAIMNTYHETGISPFVQLAIFCSESGRGTSELAMYKNNIAGMNAYATETNTVFENAFAYGSKAEAAEDFGQRLYNGYVQKGIDTLSSIGPIYASDTQWSNKIGNMVYELYATAERIQS